MLMDSEAEAHGEWLQNSTAELTHTVLCILYQINVLRNDCVDNLDEWRQSMTRHFGAAGHQGAT